ncbi:flagellar export protein FliJ [Methylophilus aquaticus]|uniref:Flagellar FliJ protein n=1 Tax=Methylophilus aquaticus TaxID=1971610 RepID=A0ABT9JU57_9PROT|nr:flagellar export protein FliJ [Methylophilus aquaticus]MDP8568122.1 flagellar export protein FliJ [Methylophilus aquaticus]
MANQSTQTLVFLQGLATEEVDAAMQALALAMQQLEQAHTQQAMLGQYQQEYQQQWQLAAQKGLKADLYRNFQGFFSQLELAVQGQNVQIAHWQSVVQQKQLELQEKQRKQKSYEVLIARAEHAQQKVERKRDQKMMDEFASRAKRSGLT